MVSQLSPDEYRGAFAERLRSGSREYRAREYRGLESRRLYLPRLKPPRWSVLPSIPGEPNATRAETKLAIGTCWGLEFLELGLGCWLPTVAIGRSND